MAFPFAVVETSELVIFAGMLTGFYAFARLILNQSQKDRSADRTERKELIKALDKLAESNKAVAANSALVAKETAKGAREAKERNGHIAELSIANTNALMTAIKEIKTQTVHEQHVDNQYVETQK